MFAGSKFTPTFGRSSFLRNTAIVSAASWPVSSPICIFFAAKRSAICRRRASSFANDGSLSSCGRNPAWNVTSGSPIFCASSASAWMFFQVSGHVPSGTTPPVLLMLSSVV